MKKGNFTPLSILAVLSLFFCFKTNAQTGNALQFSGGYVTATGIDISNASYTIEFWLKHTDDGNFNTAIGQGSTADNHGLHIGLKGGNQFYFNYYNNDFVYSTATDGNWHHWACVNDGTTTIRTIYKDGVLVATSGASSNFLGTGTLYIGQSSFGGGFNGTLDEVRIWSTARTQAEIQANKNSEVSSGTGLLAAYHCNQGTANGNNIGITTLTDATGNYNGTLNSFGLTGTTNNFVNSLPVGAALHFDGTDDYVNVPDANVLDLGASLTLEAWVKPASFSAYNMVIDKRLNTDAAANYGLTLNNGKPMFYFWTNTSDLHFHTATNAISLNTWSHIAATYDGAMVKIFVNGTQVYAQAETSIPTATNQSLNIGRNPATAQYFSGEIDEVRIWNTARTCDQISQLYNCELAGNESGLVAYYKFNQGTAEGDNTALTSLTDATSNGNNGTFNGFTLNGSSSNFVAIGGVTSGVSCGAVSAPEINLKGNNANITYGSTTPSTTNHTDFGAVASGGSFARTFTIDNTAGTAALTISSITSSNSQFVVSNIPPSVSAGSSATFTVTFTPTGYALQSSTITVNNNDCDEAAYTFTVQAMTPFTLGFGCVSGTIGNYYNGGAGPNVGVVFTTGTAGGGGLSGSANPVFNVPAGFTTGIAVSSTNLIGFRIRVFDGLDNTGTQLGSQDFVCNSCTGSLSFAGTAKSVRLERFSQPDLYDNLTFGSTTIGSALAESTVEINVKGNGNNILDGTTTTAADRDTDFGNVAANASLAKTYTIENTGSGTLTISSITSNNARFVVSNIPPSVAGNSTATFTVTFNPTAAGVQNGTITINNDDCDEAAYDFAVKGTGYNLYSFNGTTNTDWATASNWSNNSIPSSLSSGDQVVIASNCTMNSIGLTLPSGTSMTVNNGIALNLGTGSGISIASGATFTLNASASMSQGVITNAGTMDIYGSYTAYYMTNNSGGVMNVKSGGSYSCPACAETMNSGSTVNNDGTMHLGTGSTWQCTVNNNASGTITDGGNGAQVQFGSSSSVVNAGSFVSRTAGTAGSFTNSGTLSTLATCNFTIKTGSSFTNSGNMTFSSNNNVLTIQSGASLTNTGTVTNNGGMSVAGTFTNNGTYKGSGAYAGSLFTNPSGGIVAPGNSAGCMTFSNGFTNNGTLQIEVGGVTDNCAQFDKLIVTGTATLGGTLALTFSYAGAGNDQAKIIDADALSETFSSITGLAMNWFTNYNQPATGEFTLSYSSVLSAELLTFTGQYIPPFGGQGAGSNFLTWTTAEEKNVAQFDIERSADGQFFTKIGSVKSKNSNSTYAFTDNTPLSNLSFYRLKINDLGGKTDHSKIIAIESNRKGKLAISPNPVSTVLTLNTEGGDFQVFNLLGQPVLSGKTPPLGVGGLDVSALPQGTYLIRIGTEQARFIKQ
jgi:hypothetical protein